MTDRNPAPRGALTPTPQSCDCGPERGHVKTWFDDDGTQRSQWVACGDCHGTGAR
ncbi:hypothetical protein [Streptomyces sp. NPDC045369]|uniref:hypothetical protein n=1 Tax=Streptomyces sp. NPDC045369 TaxID=3155732 RepID=UPI0033EB3DB0